MPAGFDDLHVIINQVADPSGVASSAVEITSATMLVPYVEYDWIADGAGTLIRAKTQ